MRITKKIHSVLVVGLIAIIAVLSISGQKSCEWQNLPAFQKEISKLNGKLSKSNEDQIFIKKIYFLDENRGWITGNNFISKTTNGGKSWKTEQLKSNIVNDIYFTDANKGWHILINEDLTVKVYQTLNGGKTWKYLKNTSRLIFDNITDRLVFGTPPTILKIRFMNDDSVWFVGLKFVSNGAEYAIWKSENGGKSWETKHLSDGTTIRTILEASFFKISDTRLIVSNNGLIRLSEDGGENWKEVINLNGSKAKDANPDYFNSFDFVKDIEGWAIVGDSSRVFYSPDGGMNWKERKLGLKNETSYKFTSVGFIDSQTGWIAGGKYDGEKVTGIILLTTDGGKSWTIEREAKASAISAIAKTPEHIFAIESNGSMLKRLTANCTD